MCDTLCVVGSGRTLFGKSSDRPPGEPQVLEAHAARPAGATPLRTTYLEIDDAGAHALVGSRPTWMWGFEHGVNQHRVAIGNERVFTTTDPTGAPPALTGMDLVRLGLERGATADEALEVITTLLELHGQGGSGRADLDEPYWSSFLVADPRGAWVLETSGRTWAARRVDDGAAISNRVSLGVDWDRASTDVAPGTDVNTWLAPDAPTERANARLAATTACVATGAAALSPADVVATLRHHGTRPWGAPGASGAVELPPPPDAPDDTATVCWHRRGEIATTASLVAELPTDPAAPVHLWAALGSPCVSVYVPIVLATDGHAGVPPAMSDPASWARFAELRDRVEDDPGALEVVRAALDPVEAALWADADAATDPWPAVDAALATLGV